jgi:hypothetical protein
MAVPPAIDLLQLQVIGLATFDCNQEGSLDEYTTQVFLETILSNQPGIRVLELGPESELLSRAGFSQMGPEALQAMGSASGVATLFVGSLTVDSVKPKVDLSTLVGQLSVRAEVEATFTARLFETSSGATLWTASAKHKRTVGQVSAFRDGSIFFDADDPEEAYGDLVESLVYDVSTDFRVTYQRQRR